MVTVYLDSDNPDRKPDYIKNQESYATIMACINQINEEEESPVNEAYLNYLHGLLDFRDAILEKVLNS